VRSFFPNVPIGNSLSSNLLTFCPSKIPLNLRTECLALCTQGYVQGKKDCLTTIADLFHNSVPKSESWVLDYIANMPCKLLQKYGFTPGQGVKPGRILFLANKKGLIRHLVVGVPPESNPQSTEETNEIFHCSQLHQGCKIETLAELFAAHKNQRKIYYEIKCLPLMLIQRDPRTEAERVPAVVALGIEMLTRYCNPSFSSARSTASSTASLVCASLLPSKPNKEETKENEDAISIIVPKGPPFNLRKCSPIYFPTHDRTPPRSPARSHVGTFQALSLQTVGSPCQRRLSISSTRGSQNNLAMLDPSGTGDCAKGAPSER
jgi:hypothetical protein